MNESYPNVASFVVAHPFLSLMLSWPCSLVIISLCWTFATTVGNAYVTTVNFISQMGAYLVILIRGYDPESMRRYDEDNKGGNNDHKS